MATAGKSTWNLPSPVCPHGCPACIEHEEERERYGGGNVPDHDRQLAAILAAQDALFDEPDRRAA